jgi:Tol biopolymer transport system component
MRRRPALTLAFALGLGLGITSSHPALASVSTKQVSVTRRGGDPHAESSSPSLSPDGRYVAFMSGAGDLVPGDHTLHLPDIFVRDLVAGTTVRASVDSQGDDPNNSSYSPSISANGRYVGFWSDASDLVQGDGNGFPDVFVRDLVTGTTVRASGDTGDGDANGQSWYPSISADGRYVAFWSAASDLVQGDGNGFPDVFVRDLVVGTTVRASVDRDGGDPDGYSRYPSISADGRYVAFDSTASDLVEGDEIDTMDIFVRDLVTQTTVRASVDTDGGNSNGFSEWASMNADGRYVAFHSSASDLVQGDGNGYFVDIFVRDLLAGTTVRASVDTDGGDPDGESAFPSISADGRHVAFRSDATDLVPGDANGYLDVFVRDLVNEITVRASVDTHDADSDGWSEWPDLSADGRYVVFVSAARDLVPGPGDKRPDVFVARL